MRIKLKGDAGPDGAHDLKPSHVGIERSQQMAAGLVEQHGPRGDAA